MAYVAVSILGLPLFIEMIRDYFTKGVTTVCALSTAAKPWLYFANTWPLIMGVRFAYRIDKGIRIVSFLRRVFSDRCGSLLGVGVVEDGRVVGGGGRVMWG